MKHLFAIDIGGTFTKFALVTSHADIVLKEEVPTPVSVDEFSVHVDQVLGRWQRDHHIEGIAISSPGSVTDAGFVLGHSAVNFIHVVNLRALFHERYGLPVTMENDANCAALAEQWSGAGAGCDTFACIVCGTGIGGGIVINGRLHKGANLHGGEFGYSLMEGYETWSERGSSFALTKRLKDEPPHGAAWTGSRVFEEAEKGHAAAEKSLNQFFHTMAVGIFNLQYMLDPEKILVGGGITRQPSFLQRLQTELDRVMTAKPIAKVKPAVEVCTHLDQAQLIGAAYVWRKTYGKEDVHV